MVSNFVKQFRDNKPADQTMITDFLKDVKEELNEHLDSINANTAEIQTNYEYLCELENKIEKLTDKVDEVMVFLGMRKELAISKSTKLTLREQEVFWLIYLNNRGIKVSDICRRIGLTEYLSRNYIDGLAAKGIPILKKDVAGETFVCVSPEFRDAQEKQCIIAVSESVKQQIC